jgi:acyl-CoA dehydrogenase
MATECASSALVLAMHLIEAFNLVRHGDSDALRDITSRVGQGTMLLANANSEVGGGGDVSRSKSFLGGDSSPWTWEKECLAISYGVYADAILSMARRSETAPDTDMVYVLVEKADYDLQPTSEWDTLGLRGTCSRGYHVRAQVRDELIFPVPFSTVANDGAGQMRQLILSAVWVGLAEAALDRAHAFVRASARKAIGTVPPGALRVSELAGDVQACRSLLETAANRLDSLRDAGSLENGVMTIQLRNLKVTTSKLAAKVATGSLEVVGIMGMKRDGPFSVERIVRDAHGGLVMVSNDRFLHDNAQFLLVAKEI